MKHSAITLSARPIGMRTGLRLLAPSYRSEHAAEMSNGQSQAVVGAGQTGFKAPDIDAACIGVGVIPSWASMGNGFMIPTIRACAVRVPDHSRILSATPGTCKTGGFALVRT